MKILITGSSGQLGRCLADCAGKGRLPSGVRLSRLDRQELDITNAEAVNAVFRRLRPQVVINAAAWTDVNAAQQHMDQAMAVNALGAANIAAAATDHGVRLLQVSTDYVFDGSARQPIAETHPAGPLNVYGATKLAGELAVQREAPDALIIRTSWLYSAHGANFLKTVLKAGRRDGRLDVVDDQTGCPTCADDLAQVLLELAQRPDLEPGIYHYCGRDAMTWFGFARLIAQAAARHDPVWKAVQLQPIATSVLDGAAPRPAYSVLSCEKLKALGIPLHGPDEQLDRLVASISARGAN